MEAGTYTEPLPCGGNLEVEAQGFRMRYYFPGPDLRYNGTFVDIAGGDVEAYIEAFIDNWHEYERLKATVPPRGGFEKPGRMGMTIRIGPFNEGVCLRSYHM